MLRSFCSHSFTRPATCSHRLLSTSRPVMAGADQETIQKAKEQAAKFPGSDAPGERFEVRNIMPSDDNTPDPSKSIKLSPARQRLIDDVIDRVSALRLVSLSEPSRSRRMNSIGSSSKSSISESRNDRFGRMTFSITCPMLEASLKVWM